LTKQYDTEKKRENRIGIQKVLIELVGITVVVLIAKTIELITTEKKKRELVIY
jgi:hypothetical protein